MGNEHSSDFQSSTLDSSETKSKTLFRRSSTLPTKMKAPKLKHLSDFQYAASYLALRIQNFNGHRHDQQYDEIEKQIVEVSMELQRYRASLLRDADRIAADGVQKSISDCLAALLRKAQENEQTGDGRNFDDAGAGVESSSFVAQGKEDDSLVERRTESSFQSQQSLHEQQKRNKEQRRSKSRQSITKVPAKYQKRMQTLQHIEKAVLELKANITNAIFCQQTDSFEKYENKIKTICRDLELVDVEEHSPLSEKKKELYDLLIKCNNNIKKARRRMERQVAVDVPDYILARSEMTSLEEEIHRTEALLQSENEYYGDLKLKFEQLLTKVAAVRNNAELQERKKIATEVIRSNLSKIYFLEIQKKLDYFVDQIEEFSDVKYSSSFVKLDQHLRQLWDEVSTVEGCEELKLKVIAEIQKAIQTLLKKAEKNGELIKTSTLQRDEKHKKDEIDTTQEIPVYENNQIFVDQEKSKQQTEVIKKDPLPTPREESVKQKQLEEIIDEFIRQWHELKLHAETKKWSTVEKARIKIKLGNIVSNIQDIFDAIEKQNNVVMADEVAQAPKEVSETSSENKQINQTYSKPVVHVKPETSKSFKESSTEPLKTGEVDGSSRQKETEKVKKESNLERIMELQSVVEDLRVKITNFNEAVRNVEYEKIKNSIEHCVNELKASQPKGKALLEQVYELAEELELKVAENQTKSISTRTKLKELVEKLQSTKKKIDNFTGTYKNVLYTKIEEDLKQIIEDFNNLNYYGDKKLLYAINQTKQKALQYLKILESKSAKPDDVQETLLQKRSSTIPFDNIQKVRVKLMEIKDTAENFSGFDDDPIYKSMQKELTLCSRELNDIDDYGRSSIRESKLQYLNYIVEMHKYLEQKAQPRKSDEDYVITPIVTEKSDPHKQLEQIEDSFSEIVKKIEGFNGNDRLYAYLDEMLILTLIALDNLDAKDDDMTQRKNYLTSQVHKFSKLLGEKAKARKLEGQELDSLSKIRRICNSIKFEIDCRSEVDDQTYTELNERLVNLLLKIDGIAHEDEKEKASCKEFISEVLRVLQGKINYQIKFISDLDAVQI